MKAALWVMAAVIVLLAIKVDRLATAIEHKRNAIPAAAHTADSTVPSDADLEKQMAEIQQLVAENERLAAENEANLKALEDTVRRLKQVLQGSTASTEKPAVATPSVRP